MNVILFCAVGCCLACTAGAQSSRMAAGATMNRLAVYSRNHTAPLSFCWNQAVLGNVKNLQGGLYGERRFLLQDLGFYALALALPTPSGVFGWKGEYFGTAAYHESGLSLSYGRKLGERINAGIQFNYEAAKAIGYKGSSRINVEGGVLLQVTEGLNFGMHLYNPVRIVMEGSENEAPVCAAGLGYDVSTPLYIGIEVVKTAGRTLECNAGLQFHFDEGLFAAAGISSATSSFYIGGGVDLKIIRLSLVVAVHPQLGCTPGLLLSLPTGLPHE